MNWKKPSDYQLPPSAKVLGDYMLAFNVRTVLANATLNLESGDAQFLTPVAYQDSLTQYAASLKVGTFAQVYAPPAWDSAASAKVAFNSFIAFLKQLPMSLSDPDTTSIYDAWVSGKIKLPGGHDPIPTTGGTPATGQGAVVGPSIL